MSIRFAQLSGFAARESVFALGTVSLFLVLGIVGVNAHAMWRDETFPWLMARDSSSLVDWYHTIRYDAHLPFWHAVLRLLTRFSQKCQAMQWLHLALATLSAWLFARFSPFTKMQRFLFCFGYFPLYEYCIIVREYVCMMLLMFGFCVACRWRSRSYLPVSILLSLLASINIYGMLIAWCLALSLLAERIIYRDVAGLWKHKSSDWVVSAALLLLISAGGIVYTITMPHDSLVRVAWSHSFSGHQLRSALANPFRAYVPIPFAFLYRPYFDWGSNFLLDGFPKLLPVVIFISLTFVVLSIVTLWRTPIALLCYLAGTLLFAASQALISVSALRHWGLYFILFLTSVWLGRLLPTGKDRPQTGPMDWRTRLCSRFVTFLLALQVLPGLYAWGVSLVQPFSSSEAAALYVQENGLMTLPIVGSLEPLVSPVTAYLGRTIFYPDTSRLGSYCLDSTVRRAPPVTEVVARSAEIMIQQHTEVLLILSYPIGFAQGATSQELEMGWIRPNGEIVQPLEVRIHPYGQLSLLAKFTAITDEQYYLYLLRPQ
jgi:hypothetical protein